MPNYTAVENPISFTVDENVSIRAIFTVAPPDTPRPSPTPTVTPSSPAKVTLTLASVPLVGGTAQSLSSTTVVVGGTVRIVATANEGFTFDKWVYVINGNEVVASTSAEDVITVNANLTLYAKFNIIPTPTPTPTVTPTVGVSSTPFPTQTPGPTPSASQPLPTPGVSEPAAPPTPVPTQTPFPTPSASSVFWRSCIDANAYPGTPPSGYREVPFTGVGGGTCWEPSTTIAFNPDFNALQFTYQRNSSNFPGPINMKAENSSYGLSFKVQFKTNFSLFKVEPQVLFIPPRESKDFTVRIENSTINESFNDGTTAYDLEVEITQV